MDEAYRQLVQPGALSREGLARRIGAGDAISLRTATNESWSGSVEITSPPRGFCVKVKEWNRSLIWLTIEGIPGENEVQIWLSAYKVPHERVERFERDWAAELVRIFKNE